MKNWLLCLIKDVTIQGMMLEIFLFCSCPELGKEKNNQKIVINYDFVINLFDFLMNLVNDQIQQYNLPITVNNFISQIFPISKICFLSPVVLFFSGFKQEGEQGMR